MNDMTRPDAIDPPYLWEDYRSTHLRAPKEQLLEVPSGFFDVPGPLVPAGFIRDKDGDLTVHGKGTPLGERMVVAGRVLDADGKPVRRSLVEIWQANASGRYHHPVDTHDAPLDPNFHGMGRALTDDDGWYRFLTVRPGAYPWQNHPFAWRPAHIHFSLMGNAPIQRLVTQMYFPGDPLLALDPVYNSVPDEAGRKRLISTLSLETGVEGFALGYRFDIVLAGAKSTPLGL
jgi:protocatechuate 3,4-dioxygenase beta subunit